MTQATLCKRKLCLKAGSVFTWGPLVKNFMYHTIGVLVVVYMTDFLK
jgi:hypothetical protein